MSKSQNTIRSRQRSIAILLLIVLGAAAPVAYYERFFGRSPADFAVQDRKKEYEILETPPTDGPAGFGRNNRPLPASPMPQVVLIPRSNMGMAPVARNGGALPSVIALSGGRISHTAGALRNTTADLTYALHPSLKYKNWGTAASDAVTGYGLHLATVENSADQSAAPPPTPRSATQQLIDANLQMETDRHSVLAMCADQQGCLWVAAEDSVQRFDPAAPELHQWTEFTTSDGLGENGGTAIACDREGRIWVGHANNHGISIFNGQKWQNYGSAGLPNSTGGLIGPLGGRVARIATSPTDGDIWIATDCGLTRYSDSKDTWQFCALTAGEPTSVAFDKQGNIFVGTTHNGIAMADAADNYHAWREVKGPDQAPSTPSGIGLPSNVVNDVLVTTGGAIYAATDAGLAWSNDSGQTWQFTRGANWAKGIHHPAARGAGEDGVLPPRGTAAAIPLLTEDDCTCLAQTRSPGKTTGEKIFIGHRRAGADVFAPALNRVAVAGTAAFVTSIVLWDHIYIGAYGQRQHPLGYPGPGGVIALNAPTNADVAPAIAMNIRPAVFPSSALALDFDALSPAIELRNLKRLYITGQLQQVSKECASVESDSRYAGLQPQVLYIHWMAERKSGNTDESDRLERVFLDRYPRQELAAEMYLEQATNLLANGQSQAADNKLAMIADYFPHSDVAERASYIRSQLKQAATVAQQ